MRLALRPVNHPFLKPILKPNLILAKKNLIICLRARVSGANGKATLSLPHLSPFFNCSYSFWRVGQYQRFAGYEGVRQGNVFFAGEHTSVDFQGFMEGGASEGARAAQEILDQLGLA